MTATQTTSHIDINIEDMKVGRRYAKTMSPRFDHGWTVAKVETRKSKVEVIRDGVWTKFDIVTVTYHNGITLSHEVGTSLAAECDVPGVLA